MHQNPPEFRKINPRKNLQLQSTKQAELIPVSARSPSLPLISPGWADALCSCGLLGTTPGLQWTKTMTGSTRSEVDTEGV